MDRDVKMKDKDGSDRNRHNTVCGKVTARICECCGHHEIGIVTENGRYITLKPGQWVTLHQEEALLE